MPKKATIRSAIAAAMFTFLPSIHARAQMSLSTAVDLALRNSLKVKMAQADVAKAKAALSEAKAAFIPSVTASGGIGKSAGVPLSVPVVFSLSAQSLAFSFSQPDYIRAAHAGVAAANFALDAAQNEVVEDTVSTYITLDNAQQRRATLAEAGTVAARLQQIVQDRLAAGADAPVEFNKARKTALQMKLQALLVDDELDTLIDHLHRLTGMSTGTLTTVHDSIPSLAVDELATTAADDSSVKAAFANAAAKQYVAHGDKRYLWLPQFGFGAGYSRVSTIGTNYAQYYPRFDVDNPDPRFSSNSFNSLNLGIQISVPIIDYLHRAKAKASAADAAHAHFEAENARIQFSEGRIKLRHAAKELAVRVELAGIERDLAQNQLDTVLLQLQADAGAMQGATLSPKDEQNARLQERQRYLDMLNADLQLRQTQLTVLRQQGSLGTWLLKSLPPPMSGSPAAVPPVPGTSLQHP